MRKTYPGSRLEIWNSVYINFADRRAEERDKSVDIVQIEYASGDNYMVEIVSKKDKEMHLGDIIGGTNESTDSGTL